MGAVNLMAFMTLNYRIIGCKFERYCAYCLEEVLVSGSWAFVLLAFEYIPDLRFNDFIFVII